VARDVQVLSKLEVVAGDGTFNMRFPPKRKWSQLYALHGYLNGTFVPVVAIASSARTTPVYVAALRAIKQWILENLGVQWTFKVRFPG
jgi:hypothetical protein